MAHSGSMGESHLDKCTNLMKIFNFHSISTVVVAVVLFCVLFFWLLGFLFCFFAANSSIHGNGLTIL